MVAKRLYNPQHSRASRQQCNITNNKTVDGPHQVKHPASSNTPLATPRYPSQGSEQALKAQELIILISAHVGCKTTQSLFFKALLSRKPLPYCTWCSDPGCFISAHFQDSVTSFVHFTPVVSWGWGVSLQPLHHLKQAKKHS